MKIWFRIDAKRDGPLPPESHTSTETKVRFLHPGGISRRRFLKAVGPAGRANQERSPTPKSQSLQPEKCSKLGAFLQSGRPLLTESEAKTDVVENKN